MERPRVHNVQRKSAARRRAAGWALAITVMFAACSRGGDPVKHRQAVSDYPVYSAVLRAYFLAPPADAHGDGADEACDAGGSVDHLSLVSETTLRRRGDQSRDSALAAELSPRAKPMVATLRAISAQPGRVLDPDSLAVPVPVVLTDSAQASRKERPITLSRVAYSADSTDALVLAVQTCPAAHKHRKRADRDAPVPGQSVLVALHRQRGAWAVREHVQLEVE